MEVKLFAQNFNPFGFFARKDTLFFANCLRFAQFFAFLPATRQKKCDKSGIMSLICRISREANLHLIQKGHHSQV